MTDEFVQNENFVPPSYSTSDAAPPFARSKSEPLFCVFREIGGLGLTRPLAVVVEPDEDGFIARSPPLPQLYGAGDSQEEALEMFEREVLSLRADLQSDREFSDGWTEVAELLAELFGDGER
jgi:hypothetical protein